MKKEEKIARIRNYFLETKETIAIAESVTSGLMQFFFSSIPDAGKFYQGGITAYNLGQKYKHLNVEPIQAQSCNCVSAEVAQQMALEVCNLFHSHWGIATTGYANPVPESGNDLFVFFAVSRNGIIQLAEKIPAKKSAPEEVQIFFMDAVTDKFLDVLESLK